MAFRSYDHVVEDADTHQLADFPQAAGDLDVFGARSRIPARVIVNENHGGRRITHRWRKNLPRMNDRRRKRSFRDLYLAELSVLRVEKQDAKNFFPQWREPAAKMVEHFAARAKHSAVLDPCADEAPPELKGGRHGSGLGRPDPAHPSELGRSGSGNVGKSAERFHQPTGLIDGGFTRSAASQQQRQQFGIG